MPKWIPYAIISSCVILLGSISFILLTQNNNSNETSIPAGLQKEISLKDISTHNSASDCWVYIGGQVFDATKVIAQNSSLTSTLTSVCGGDGSTVYTVQKYSKQVVTKAEIVKLRDALSMYQLGLLAP